MVFDGAVPLASAVIARAVSEGRAWEIAGLLKNDCGSFYGWLGGRLGLISLPCTL